MNIRQKMLISAGLLTLVPVLITAVLLWQGASSLAGSALSERNQSQLSALRDLKRVEVNDQISNRVKSLQVLATQRSTVDAMRTFKGAFASAAKDSGAGTGADAALTKYAKEQFGPEFTKRNATTAPDISKAIAALDANGAALQNDFIVNNPNPLGQKEKLNKPAGNYPYAQAHAQFHPGLERAQKLNEYYDIFLIDTETDTVVYTVFKELDFGSKLAGNGVAAGTKLAEAYGKAKQAANRDASYLSDFSPYLASYDDLAAFAAVPVFDGDRQIGVLAMQYPIDKISDTMSSNKAWKKSGLGDTGDVFIVGADKLMRSNARYMSENKTEFAKLLGAKLPAATSAKMLQKDSSIGLVAIDTDETRAALAGQEGFMEYIDYRGIPAYAAFGPLKVQGLTWALVAKIDKAEADTTLNALNNQSLLRALLIGLVVVVVAGALVTYFLQQFLQPIQKLSDTVQKVAAGDTAARSQLLEQDEIGQLGRSFDGMLDEHHATLEKAVKENETLNNSVVGLLQAVFQLGNRDLTVRAEVTEDIIGTVSSSINQFTDETGRTLNEVKDIAEHVRKTSESVRVQSVMVEETARAEREALDAMSNNLSTATTQLSQVAALSDASNVAAEQAATATQAALAAVNGTVQGMDQLRGSISDLEKRFKRLGERSQEISSAVQLINNISERTHVLALNASMQAATAGEAGRGFAVVAEEVQRLSDSSRQATGQISQLVGNIQAETNETLFTVNRLIGDVVKQSELARRAGLQMNQTQDTTTQLVSLVRQIAAFSEQQVQLSSSLQQSVLDMNHGTEQTSSAIAEQTASTQTLVDFSRRLTEAVGQFKLPAAART